MKKLLTILGIIFLCATCVSCGRNRPCIEQVVSFVEIQKEHAADYTEADWDSVNLIYMKLLIAAKPYEKELSISEKKNLGVASTQFVLLQRHRDKNQLKQSLLKERLLNEIQHQ